MEEIYKTKKILSAVAKNTSLGRFLGTEKSKNAVLGVMNKQHITVDPGKLSGSKKAAFLRAVSDTHVFGATAKKAFGSVYGKNKEQAEKQPAAAGNSRQEIYDKIMSKKNGFMERKALAENKTSSGPAREKSKVLDFRVSGMNIREADGLLAKAQDNRHPIYDTGHGMGAGNEKEDRIARLKNIQS